MTRWAIVADDLTGCTDTAVSFARERRPIQARMMAAAAPLMHPGAARGGQPYDDQVIALDTESRSLDQAEAAGATAAGVREARSLGAGVIYKKIDSLMRGPLDAELVACHQELEPGLAVLCPALPSAGRTTRGGYQCLGSVPIPGGDLLQRLPGAGFVSLTRVRRGDLARALDALESRECQFAVVDATSDEDLERIADVVLARGELKLVAGTAGLAGVLAQRLVPGKVPAIAVRLPSLVVCGSFSPVAAAQAALLAQTNAGTLIPVPEPTLRCIAEGLQPRGDKRAGTERPIGPGGSVNPETSEEDSYPPGSQCWGNKKADVDKWADRVAETAARGRTPVLLIEGGRVPAVHRTLAVGLARIAAAAMSRIELQSVVLIGGDTAFAVLDALQLDRLEILGTVFPQIPALRASHGSETSLQVITKAGAFGKPDTLVRVLRGETYCNE